MVQIWLRGLDLNQRPFGYEPNELPDCSTPRCTVLLYIINALLSTLFLEKLFSCEFDKIAIIVD